MKKATFEACCIELQRRGYETLFWQEVGIHRTITEMLEDAEPDGKEEYTIFGNLIVRISDNWKDHAEIYIAE